MFAGRCDLTTNASMTFYNETELLPEGIDAFRDAALSVQFDYRLGELLSGRMFLWSDALRYARLQSTLTTIAGENEVSMAAFTAEGVNQIVVQTMLSIPVSDSGVKIPLSLSRANQSDLIEESHLRGNFGVTLDLDSVFGFGG